MVTGVLLCRQNRERAQGRRADAQKSLNDQLSAAFTGDRAQYGPFRQVQKSLQITPEGKKLLGWTITTFETLQSMRSAVGDIRRPPAGRHLPGATLPVAIMAVDAIAAFRAENPQVNIRIQRALSSEIVQAVKESRLDFGLTGMTVPCPRRIPWRSC